MNKALLGKHAVAWVRAIGGGGARTEQPYVRCERRQESVPVSECRECIHCVDVRAAGPDRPVTVLCRVPLEGPEGERQAQLNVPRLSVGDVMTRNVLCVRPELSLDAVTELFVESGLKTAPVVDDRGVLLGTVSESDVLLDVHAQCQMSEPASYDALEVDGEQLHHLPPVRTVAEVMMPVALTLAESAPMTQAAALMAYEGVFHVVVLSAEGKVVGILSASDILHRLARSDGYLMPAPRH